MSEDKTNGTNGDAEALDQAAETTAASTDGAEAKPAPEARLMIHSHYIKDLSFESPKAPAIFTRMRDKPDIKVSINVGLRQLSEKLFETVLKIEINAKAGEETAFVIELDLAAVSSVHESVTPEERDVLLHVEVPRHLFPFARNMVAEISRDGGFPPLLINPIDFARLRAQRQAASAASGGPAAPQGDTPLV